MLSGTGLNPFYYVRDLTEMCCKHSWGGDYTRTASLRAM